jgi:hypothetical protein
LTATVGFGLVAERGFAKLDHVIRNLNLDSMFIEKILDIRFAMEISFVAPMASNGRMVAAAGAAMVVIGVMLAKSRPTKIHVPKKSTAVGQTESGRDAHSVIDSLKDEILVAVGP